MTLVYCNRYDSYNELIELLLALSYNSDVELVDIHERTWKRNNK